jgi:hypothetical protein
MIAGEGGLLIRLDDDDDPEYWEEIRVTEIELLRLLAKVHRATHGNKTQRHLFPETLIEIGDLSRACECESQPKQV